MSARRFIVQPVLADDAPMLGSLVAHWLEEHGSVELELGNLPPGAIGVVEVPALHSWPVAEGRAEELARNTIDNVYGAGGWELAIFDVAQEVDEVSSRMMLRLEVTVIPREEP